MDTVRAHLRTVWYNMKKRCLNKKDAQYPYYGGRDIKICSQWNNFETFLEDMIPTYKKGLQIERIDNNDGYFPKNCKWVTPIGQANNKRNNHMVTCGGETKTLAQWAKELEIPYSTLICRINKHGWDTDKALSTQAMPHTQRRLITWKNKTLSLSEWSKITGIGATTISYRFNAGFTSDKIFAKPRKMKRQTFKNHRVTWNGKTLLVSEWAKRLNIGYTTLISRFKANWPIDRIFSTDPKEYHTSLAGIS